MLRGCAAIAGAGLMWVHAHAAPPTSNDWIFLDNGHVRLGVIRSSGAGIAWFSPSGSTNNAINYFDRGRLIQQSYYGRTDGTFWAKKPWRWNPVQGGVRG